MLFQELSTVPPLDWMINDIRLVCNHMDDSPPGSSSPWHFPGKNTGVGYHFLLWGIFPTQGLNSHPLHLQVGSLPRSQLGSRMNDTVSLIKVLAVCWKWRVEKRQSWVGSVAVSYSGHKGAIPQVKQWTTLTNSPPLSLSKLPLKLSLEGPGTHLQTIHIGHCPSWAVSRYHLMMMKQPSTIHSLFSLCSLLPPRFLGLQVNQS